LAATVFVSFDDLAFVDLLAGSGIMRPKRDPSGSATLVRVRSARSCGADDAEPCPALRSGNSSSSTSTDAGCHTWCKRIGFVRVVAGDK
jgi:hypothetical protein